MGYCDNMLTGIRIFTSDAVWRQILGDLNATVLESPGYMDVNLDDIEFDGPISPMELKARIIAALDMSEMIHRIFGRAVSLSRPQAKIVVALYKSGGMTSDELKVALGYAHDTATHAVDTAIYQLRKTFGHDFIINSKGVYSLGRV